MLTWKQKECCMQVCQDLLKQCKAEGDNFLYRILLVMRRGVIYASWSPWNDNVNPFIGDKVKDTVVSRQNDVYCLVG